MGGDETAGMSLIDKSDLFFHDYSIAPLFVQENYVNVIPYAAKYVISDKFILIHKSISKYEVA